MRPAPRPALAELRDVVAVVRLSRLVAVDDFPPLADAREWLIDRLGDDHVLAELVLCRWCNSAYLGLAALAARRWAPRTWAVAAWALTASYASGAASAWEQRREVEREAAHAAGRLVDVGRRMANTVDRVADRLLGDEVGANGSSSETG